MEAITLIPNNSEVKPKPASGAVKTPSTQYRGFAANDPRVHRSCSRSSLMTASVELFPGQYFDEETELHYNHFRYYDPQTGRYITSDRIGLLAGPNTYAYARGNPLTRIDPLGLADIFVGVEVDLTGLFGVEFSFGVVADTDSPLQSGLFGSIGFGVGANVGIGIGGGYAECDIEGSSTGFDINVPFGSVYGGIGEDGGTFLGGSIGIGIGASGNVTETGTFSVEDYVNFVLGR